MGRGMHVRVHFRYLEQGMRRQGVARFPGRLQGQASCSQAPCFGCRHSSGSLLAWLSQSHWLGLSPGSPLRLLACLNHTQDLRGDKKGFVKSAYQRLPCCSGDSFCSAQGYSLWISAHSM